MSSVKKDYEIMKCVTPKPNAGAVSYAVTRLRTSPIHVRVRVCRRVCVRACAYVRTPRNRVTA